MAPCENSSVHRDGSLTLLGDQDARTAEGMDAWIDWLIEERAIHRPARAAHPARVHG
jgi:hypothetical protein